MPIRVRQLIELNFSVLLLALIPIAGKLVQVSPPVAILARAGFTLFALSLIMLSLGVGYGIRGRSKWAWLLFTGFFMALHQVSYFYAIQMANASMAMLTLFTYPVWITLAEPLIFKNPFRWRHLGVALAVVCGVLFILPNWDFKNTYTLGIIIGLISAFLFAVRCVYVKRYLSEVPSLAVMFYHHVVIGGLLILVAGQAAVQAPWTLQSVVALMLIGMVFSSVGHTLTLKSYQVMNARKVAIISSWQPVLSVSLAALLLGEIPSFRTLIGGALVIAVVVFETVFSAPGQTVQNADPE